MNSGFRSMTPLPGGGEASSNNTVEVRLLGSLISRSGSVLTCYGSPIGGEWQIGYETGRATLDYDCSASVLEAALEGMTGIGSGNASCSGGPFPDNPITISATGWNVNRLVLNYGKLIGGWIDPSDYDYIPCALMDSTGAATFSVVKGYSNSANWAVNMETLAVKQADNRYIIQPASYVQTVNASEDIDVDAEGDIDVTIDGIEWPWSARWNLVGTARGKNIGPQKILSGDKVVGIPILGKWLIFALAGKSKGTQIVITQATITANSSGNCKFTTGAFGSETATGSNVTMYWRTTDSVSIPSGTKCYATEIYNSAGVFLRWELDPVGCL